MNRPMMPVAPTHRLCSLHPTMITFAPTSSEIPTFDTWKHRLRSTRGQRTQEILSQTWRFIGWPRALAPLHRILRARDADRDPEERTAAIKALGVLADPIGLLPVLGILEDPDADPALRAEAAQALARGGAWFVPVLEASLDAKFPVEVRLAAARSLLAGQAHALAAQTVRDLIANEPTDPDERRLLTLADLALEDHAAIARRGLDGRDWPELSSWALASARERQALDAQDLALRVLSGSAEALALDAPTLALARPEMLVQLLDEDWNPNAEDRDRRLWLAGLLGPAAQVLYTRWARHPKAPQQIHLWAGLAGSSSTGNSAWKWGQALGHARGLDDLLSLLPQSAADKNLHALIQTILIHHSRWRDDTSQLAQSLVENATKAKYPDLSPVIWALGELGPAASGHEDFLAKAFPEQAFAVWALGEIGTTKALGLLRNLPVPDGDDHSAARAALAFACIQHGISRGPLSIFGPQSASEPYAYRYTLVAGDRSLTPPSSSKSVDEACLGLVRNGPPWRGPNSPADLDEAVVLLVQTGHPAQALYLLGVTQDDDLRCEMLERIHESLRPQHGPEVQQVQKFLSGLDDDSQALRWLDAIAKQLSTGIQGQRLRAMPAHLHRRVALGLSLLDGSPQDAGAALAVLGAPIEDLARFWLAIPCENYFDAALKHLGYPERSELCDSGGYLGPQGLELLNRITTWIDHPRIAPETNEWKILRKGLVKLSNHYGASWRLSPGRVNDTLDGLGPWTAALAILNLAGKPHPIQTPQTITAAFLVFQSLRNSHTHKTAHSTDQERELARWSVGRVCC